MVLLQVTSSGSIGKQVFGTSNSTAELCGALLTPTSAAATMVIRDGNASGEVVLTLTRPANDSGPAGHIAHKFTKGMHVKVTPGAALGYLVLK